MTDDDADAARRHRDSTFPLVVLLMLMLLGFGGLVAYILIGAR